MSGGNEITSEILETGGLSRCSDDRVAADCRLNCSRCCRDERDRASVRKLSGDREDRRKFADGASIDRRASPKLRHMIDSDVKYESQYQRDFRTENKNRKIEQTEYSEYLEG